MVLFLIFCLLIENGFLTSCPVCIARDTSLWGVAPRRWNTCLGIFSCIAEIYLESLIQHYLVAKSFRKIIIAVLHKHLITDVSGKKNPVLVCFAKQMCY